MGLKSPHKIHINRAVQNNKVVSSLYIFVTIRLRPNSWFTSSQLGFLTIFML